MVMPEIKDLSKPILHLILFDHAATAKHFSAIQVFDARGRLTIDASSLDPRPENRADENTSRSIATIPMWASSSQSRCCIVGAYSIVLSRRISGEDGSFLGVVVGAIRFSYFHALFDRLNLGEGDTITVLRRDRVHHHAQAVRPRRHRQERNDAGDVLGQGQVPEQRGTPDGPGGCDAAAVRPARHIRPALCSWSASRSRRSSASGSRKYEARRDLGGLILFVLATRCSWRAKSARRAAAEDKLEELATTDSLTGLRNRRKFDSEIETSGGARARTRRRSRC
jgi:hypothetical protein